jgi:NAD+ synthase
MNRIINYQNLSNSIQEWINNYVKKSNLKTLVVGVSGGIDSAVVSTICAKTGLPTIVVGISINSDKKNTELSELHIKSLQNRYKNVSGFTMDVSSVFNEFKSISLFENNFNSNLGFANSKSRMRMICLYQIATSTNGIVVGTGNKVEDFGVGFYTKYGDGGVDISPIADLYKTEVRELGKFLEVDQEIIQATPTDGLWEDNRNDESQIGCTYEELEWVMEYGIKKPKPTENEYELIEKYLSLNEKNKHKMVSIPIFNLHENKIL